MFFGHGSNLNFLLTILYQGHILISEVFFSYPYGLRQTRIREHWNFVAVSAEFLADTSGIICYEVTMDVNTQHEIYGCILNRKFLSHYQSFQDIFHIPRRYSHYLAVLS